MTVFEYGGRLLIVDCGVLFPEDHQPGVDLILPDFEYVRDRLEQVEAIVLTHGHEDHIGAVPFLLREKPDLPLVGSRLTLALVEEKLVEHKIETYQLEVAAGRTERFAIRVEFLAVNHSIPMRSHSQSGHRPGWFSTPATSRWTTAAGRTTDRSQRLRALGDAGVDLFMVDSTNAEVPGYTPHEREIAPVLDRIFAEAPRRIVVAFAGQFIGAVGARRVRRTLAQGRIRRPVDGPQHGNRS